MALHYHSYTLRDIGESVVVPYQPPYAERYCPSGHYNCIFITISGIKVASVAYNTSVSDDTVGHTHNLTIVSSVSDSGDIAIPRGPSTCPAGHEKCYCASWYLYSICLSATHTTVQTWSAGSGTHRHYYVSLMAPSLEYSLTTCPAGHANCQLVPLESTQILRTSTGFYYTDYDIPSVSLPTVSTNSASDITRISATLNGEITATGGENADERGFDYGKTNSYGSSWTETGSFGVESFDRALTGLDPNTTYHFMAKAHNSAGWGYGSDESFTTLIPHRHHPTIPTEPNRGKESSKMGSL